MMFLAIFLLGVISIVRIPQELFPSVTYPQLTVATSYANAAPEEIETLITKIVEEAISTVKNIKQIRSISKEGMSMVIADFNWGVDMNIAALNMREKIDMVKEMLPRDAEEPIVLKFNPYATPILILSVTGTQPSEELRRISKKIIKDKLEKIEGVASAAITGGKEREIQVKVDMAQLKSAYTDLLAVVESIKNANLNYPAGSTKEKFYEYLLRTVGEFTSVKEIPEVPVKVYDVEEEERKEKEEKRTPSREEEKRIIHKKRLILLRDIATIIDTFKEPTSHSRYNGRDNISIAIQKQADANTIKTVARVKEALDRMKDMLPQGLSMEIVYDESTYIRASIKDLIDNAWQGGLLTFLVLLMFLRSFVNSIVVTVTIPFTLLATFSFMYFQGVSINMMSLGGLALGVGMLLDNSIVIVDNIYRKEQGGTPRKEASILGTEEVSAPLMATTMTTVAVFLPMVFLIGIAGQIFKDMSFTICFSQTISIFIALTSIPLLIAYTKTSAISLEEKKKFDFVPYLAKMNGKILSIFMRHKIIGLLIVISLFIFSMNLLKYVDKELMPKVDAGQFTLKVNCLTGTKLEITNGVAKAIEDYLLTQPEVLRVSAIIGSARKSATEAVSETLGSHQAQIMVNLKTDRKIKTGEFVQRLKDRMDTLIPKYAKIDYIMQESIFMAGMEIKAPIVIKLHGPDIEKLNNLADEVVKKISPIKGLYGVENKAPKKSKETKVKIYKDKASIYNINVRDIAQTSLIAIKGLTASKFKEGGDEFDISVRLDEKYRSSLTSLKGIQIYSPQGFFVPLDELATIKSGEGPSEINRYDQQRVIFVSSNLYKEKLSAVTDNITKVLESIEKPEGYSVELVGESEEAKQSFKNILFVLIMATTLVYMIMASQFESLWQPFIIMFTVPFAMIGVAPALILTNTSLNIIALLGLILLVGVVVNNAIVLIDFMNSMRQEGKPIEEAAIESSIVRLRPILMTAFTSIIGLIPMAFSRGEGAELRVPMAITVMGGFTTSTILTLWVIPVLYVLVSNLLEKFKKPEQEETNTEIKTDQ
jgi:HAE1 family hydrophobic/amphiphilic exporter-1